MLSDNYIKKLTRYSSSRSAREKDGITLLDGLHVVQEVLMHAPDLVKDIYYTENSLTDNPEIRGFVDTHKNDTFTLIAGRTLKKIAPTTTPSGILAVIHIPSSAQTVPTDAQCILMLDTISDPGNVGTIIRTGVALGVDAVILSKGSADAWSPKVLRAAQGAHFSTTIISDYDFSRIKESFDGRIVGSFLDETTSSIYSTNLTGKVGIVIGNEGAGINPEQFRAYGDQKIYIPMQRGFESLNVGIATGIILSERLRQTLQP